MKDKNLLAELAAYLFSASHGETGRTPSERELAEHFAVSRGQIREALAILEAMQIVERRAKSGIYLTTRKASVEAMALFAKAGVPLDPIQIYETVELRKIHEIKAADIFQPDPAFCGGISEAMKIGAIASAFNLRLAPHLWAGAPCFFAGLHICAASPASFTVEYSLGANPMIHDLVEDKIEVCDGLIAIPEKPGLGFTMSEKFLEAHAQG